MSVHCRHRRWVTEGDVYNSGHEPGGYRRRIEVQAMLASTPAPSPAPAPKPDMPDAPVRLCAHCAVVRIDPVRVVAYHQRYCSVRCRRRAYARQRRLRALARPEPVLTPELHASIVAEMIRALAAVRVDIEATQ